MKKNKICILLSLFLCMSLNGCKVISIKNEGEEVKDKNEIVTQKSDQSVEDIQFMIDSYGFTKEELEGVDVTKLIQDYELKVRTFTNEEVREIIESQAKYYIDDGKTKLFRIFDTLAEGSIKAGDHFNKIAMVYNEGTFQQNIIFDLVENKWYLDDATLHELSAKQKEMVEKLPEKYEIYNWENNYSGEEEESTGSLYWKLIFEKQDGSLCAYTGYTQDGTHLPPNYKEFCDDIISILKDDSYK